jgi:hypothetical protein
VGVLVGLYFAGLLVGLGASVALDVQLRRPGIRQGVGLAMFVMLAWGVLLVTGTQFTQILLPTMWGGTGVLAGLGSRDFAATH